MVDSDTLRKSNFYTDVVTEAYSNGEGEAVSVSTIDKRVVPVSGWISCKCNIDESMSVKIISPEGVKRVKNIEELEDSTMAFYIDFRKSHSSPFISNKISLNSIALSKSSSLAACFISSSIF